MELFLHNINAIPKKCSFFIYGTGSCAKHLKLILSKSGRKNFKGFIDTNISDLKKQIFSLADFFSIESFQDELIIVASSFFNEILPKLIEANIDTIYIYPSINFENKKYYRHGPIQATDPRIFSDNFRIGGYRNENLLRKSILKIIKHTMVTYDGLCSLADMVRYLEKKNIKGNFVELGCHKGGASALMALVNKQFSTLPRHIHAFDSFEGLPEPCKKKDNLGETSRLWGIPKNKCNGILKNTGSLVAEEENIIKLVFEDK